MKRPSAYLAEICAARWPTRRLLGDTNRNGRARHFLLLANGWFGVECRRIQSAPSRETSPVVFSGHNFRWATVRAAIVSACVSVALGLLSATVSMRDMRRGSAQNERTSGRGASGKKTNARRRSEVVVVLSQRFSAQSHEPKTPTPPW